MGDSCAKADVLGDVSNYSLLEEASESPKMMAKTPKKSTVDVRDSVASLSTETMDTSTPSNRRGTPAADKTLEDMDTATPLRQRKIITPKRRSPRTSTSPVKPVTRSPTKRVSGGLQEAKGAENISPRKRTSLTTSSTVECIREDHVIDVKRTRFGDRRNSHVPDIPQFTAPVLWNLDVGTDATSLLVTDNRCIVGTADGAVITLDLNGKPIRVQKLPVPIGALLKDEEFLYAWCPNRYGFQRWKGALYDITSENPRLQFEVEDLGESLVYSSMHGGLLVLGDDKGSLFLLNGAGHLIWHTDGTEPASKLLLTDDSGIYFGHRKKVSKFSWKDGSILWEHQATGRFAVVQNGTMNEEHLYVEVSGRIIQLSKEDGTLTKEYIPARHRASGIAIGNGILITGSCPTAIFDIESGDEKFRMNFAGRLQDAVIKLHSRGRCYAAWDKVYCIDVTEEALLRAVAGRSTRTLPMTLDGATCIHASDVIPMTTQSGRGVLVECSLREGKVVVRTNADGYDDCWPVHIPKPYCIPGKKFICDALIASAKHMFYRPHGDIYELVTPEEMKAGLQRQIIDNEHQSDSLVSEVPGEDENQNEIVNGISNEESYENGTQSTGENTCSTGENIENSSDN